MITKTQVAKAWAEAMMAEYNASICKDAAIKADLAAKADALRANGCKMRYAFAKQSGVHEHAVRREIHPKAEAIFFKMRGF